ncbi:MAG: ferritin family protein [Bacteroidota bacterium]
MNTNNITDLFDFALSQENEASAFYTELAEKVQNSGVRQIFLELADDEKGHAMLIENYRNNPALEDKFHPPTYNYKVSESEEKPEMTSNMSPSDAIALAMKREQEAADLYLALTQSAKDESEKTILTNLANMELKHKIMLEDAFVNIGYPEVF